MSYLGWGCKDLYGRILKFLYTSHFSKQKIKRYFLVLGLFYHRKTFKTYVYKRTSGGLPLW